MVAAKTLQEWYAFFGGEEMLVSRDEAAVVWEAATKAVESRKTTPNSDYAAALRVKEEYLRTATPEQMGRGFMSWCEEKIAKDNP